MVNFNHGSQPTMIVPIRELLTAQIGRLIQGSVTWNRIDSNHSIGLSICRPKLAIFRKFSSNCLIGRSLLAGTATERALTTFKMCRTNAENFFTLNRTTIHDILSRGLSHSRPSKLQCLVHTHTHTHIHTERSSHIGTISHVGPICRMKIASSSLRVCK